MSYHIQHSQRAYNQLATSTNSWASHSSITTVASPQLPDDSYYLPVPYYSSQQLPAAPVLQYLSSPLPDHPWMSSSYTSSARIARRHPTQFDTDSIPSTSRFLPFSRAPTHTSRAVIIGINYFRQKGELRKACRDARNFFTYLTQVKHYRPEDMIFLTDDQNGVHSQPTRQNILDAISWIGIHAEPAETAVIFYSGHGSVATQGQVQSQEDVQTIYPVDFRKFPKGMITEEEFHERLKPAQMRGAKLIVVLDTCVAVPP